MFLLTCFVVISAPSLRRRLICLREIMMAMLQDDREESMRKSALKTINHSVGSVVATV